MASSKRRSSTSKKQTRKKAPERIERRDLEKLIYGEGGSRRFTQDSPVLPDVWFEFGEKLTGKVDLLLNPHYEASPGRVAQVVEERLAHEEGSAAAANFPCDDNGGPDIAYNQSTVVVRLCFRELVRVVLPLTDWWKRNVWKSDGKQLRLFLTDKKIRAGIARVLDGAPVETLVEEVDPQLIWMMKVIGTIGAAARSSGPRKGPPTSKQIIDACTDLITGLEPFDAKALPPIWTITRNRAATVSIARSTMAVKADAARRLFEINCSKLSWAIIDSGIDARHPAFRVRDRAGKLDPNEFNTRVTATYDFTVIRQLLRSDKRADENAMASAKPALVKAMKRIDAQKVKDLRRSLQSGREVDWEMLKPLIEVPHDKKNYIVPKHSHGTHVAGIVAADWRTDDSPSSGDYAVRGVCPDMKLYDLRVLDDQGQGDEFSCIAAMQFVRYLNAHKDLMVIHGVNLSLSIRHDVANYACGSTPVCEEANRLVGAGTVVVTAAGNNGYLYFITTTGPEEGYRSISITDPGNTDSVITVGATHRDSAHLYGVSYFSSRGPTGDGRIKPDLVAPGEKIESTIPDGKKVRMDGTSMAAPHVSGASALLLARYPELMGKPARIKEILCKTATDLGRERYFQGAGMVDALRALQSV
ncbi:MAG TPA: S8 family peptidase [Pyrinomonadaceae bacterium]|nr:S8 family peptidase [Pyrinomonadaceae bacterium]